MQGRETTNAPRAWARGVTGGGREKPAAGLTSSSCAGRPVSSGTFTRACGSRRSSVDRPPAYGNERRAAKSIRAHGSAARQPVAMSDGSGAVIVTGALKEVTSLMETIC